MVEDPVNCGELGGHPSLGENRGDFRTIVFLNWGSHDDSQEFHHGVEPRGSFSTEMCIETRKKRHSEATRVATCFRLVVPLLNTARNGSRFNVHVRGRVKLRVRRFSWYPLFFGS